MTWTLDGGEPEVTDRDYDPSPEVLTPEVRQRTRLRRLRNLSIFLVICAIVVGYFTVIQPNFAESQLFDS
jgi:hypothetical protein